MTLTHSELDDLQPSMVDRYHLMRPMGEGATSTGYLAREVRHDRSVAVKVLRPDIVSGPAAQRFLREIQIIAKLTHPHILPLLDSGEALGRPYYVMPFIEGASLQDRLGAGQPLPVEESIRLACQIADALGYAHAAGVLHRDIKPGNILMAGAHALVADFGASRLLQPGVGELAMTTPGIG